MKEALIIFIRNPVLGKVKTRLAATIGNERALAVYTFLLAHTKSITENLPFSKYVFYSDEINTDDLWNGYQKKLQCGNNLGERMQHAFKYLFKAGYQHIGIIGSDCYALDERVIMEGFKQMETNEVTIGPATDGGYYFLGMEGSFKNLFQQISWGSSNVFETTLEAVKSQQLSFHLLPMLQDVDEEKDITFHY